VILYNSNLDKSVANRKTKADLKRDLKKWEEDMAKKKKQPVIDAVSYQVSGGGRNVNSSYSLVIITLIIDRLVL
jgi:hypothetical protein